MIYRLRHENGSGDILLLTRITSSTASTTYYISSRKIKFPQLKVPTARLIPNALQLPFFLHVRFFFQNSHTHQPVAIFTQTRWWHTLYRNVKSTSCLWDYQKFVYFGPVQTIIQTVNFCLKRTHHFGSNQQIKGALPRSHMH